MSDGRRYPSIRIRSIERTHGLQPSDPEAPYAMESSDELSESSPVTFGIDSTRRMTDGDFEEVEIHATNTTDEPVTVRFGVTPPFSSYVGAVDFETNRRTEALSNPGNRLYLIPVGATDSTINDSLLPRSTSDDLWRLTTHIDIPQVGHRRTLFPSETLSRNYAVLAPSRQELPSNEVPPNSYGLLSGEYAFEERYALLKSESGDRNEWIRWRFVVEITK